MLTSPNRDRQELTSDQIEADAAQRPRRGALQDLRRGLLARFIVDETVLEVGASVLDVPDESQPTVFASYRLESMADYRSALTAWFAAVRIGGHLILVVPHAFLHDRRLMLPAAPWSPGQQRLYTPGSLLNEVEEALAASSYQVSLLADDDRGYDYGMPVDIEPVGRSAIILVLEKIRLSHGKPGIPTAPQSASPAQTIQPSRAKVQTLSPHSPNKVLILKLDHLGDFIMCLPALRKARALFADAEITLVVGSWNLTMASELEIADRVVAFDAFPRNSSEEEVDIPGKSGLFKRTLPDEYDIAIDLRTDTDTRVLLKNARARIKAGVGDRSHFPFLDISLPLDFNRNEPATAREDMFGPLSFTSQSATVRNRNRITSDAKSVDPGSAIVWGPYHRLRPGRYFFEPFLELDPGSEGGVLMVDIGLTAARMASVLLPTSDRIRLYFEVAKPDLEFEFRIWSVAGALPISFSFFGGRLVREGTASVLHQSEYLLLLIELISIRMESMMLSDEAFASLSC